MKKSPKRVLHELWLEQHGEESRAALFRNVKERLPELEALRQEALAGWPPQAMYEIDDRSFQECRRLQPLIQKIAGGVAGTIARSSHPAALPKRHCPGDRH